MKATKLIKESIERLNISINDCDIIYQATMFGESIATKFDAAIIYVNASSELYTIRAWYNGGIRIEKFEGDMRDAFIKTLLLK